MKKIFFLGISFFVCSQLFSQITKGNWLWGGNISFSNEKDRNDLGSQSNESRVQVSGNGGYFLINKLAIGIRPNYYFTKTKTPVNTINQNNFSIGPFVRYYFLSSESRVNLFSDGGYSYGVYKSTYQQSVSSSTVYFSGGPVIFLNSSVAVEFSIGYSSTKTNDNSHNKKNLFQSGIGLQFHLEREKND